MVIYTYNMTYFIWGTTETTNRFTINVYWIMHTCRWKTLFRDIFYITLNGWRQWRHSRDAVTGLTKRISIPPSCLDIFVVVTFRYSRVRKIMEFICKWNYAEHCIFGYTKKNSKKNKRKTAIYVEKKYINNLYVHKISIILFHKYIIYKWEG